MYLVFTFYSRIILSITDVNKETKVNLLTPVI